jgi:hypothetical protein
MKPRTPLNERISVVVKRLQVRKARLQHTHALLDARVLRLVRSPPALALGLFAMYYVAYRTYMRFLPR